MRRSAESMQLPIYVVDAFARNRFEGNSAAVVILDDWLPDDVLQSIAMEHNLSETAFIVPGDETTKLRWFTPTVEVDLCGHATLASAAVMFENGYTTRPEIVFQYGGGTLTVIRDGDLLSMDFPARPPKSIECEPALVEALGATPTEVHEARDLLVVFASQADVEALTPDFRAVEQLDTFAVIATAPGVDCDFVYRFFAPAAGVPEDPATGSAQCTLIPYWSGRLGKSTLHALQVSRRSAEFFCEDRGERVTISGRAIPYLRGTITI